MDIRELEREVGAVMRKYRRQALRAGTASPEDETAGVMRSILDAMRAVVRDAAELQMIVQASPRIQAAQAGDPWEPFGSVLQVGDFQDAVAVWESFSKWLRTPVDVGGRQVVPLALIQRREAIYSAPADQGGPGGP